MASTSFAAYGSEAESPPPSARQRYQSEPLSPDGSSDGSTRASSTTTSPILSNQRYIFPASAPVYSSSEMQYSPTYPTTPTATDFGSPGTDLDQDVTLSSRYSDDRRSKQSPCRRDFPVCCLHPGCTARPFKRRADLDRHYKHRHAPDSLKESFTCDYQRCSRHLEPFHRLDHFRDHLREFHKEDIEKRGGSQDDSWLGNRQVSSSWWRCSKCLKRVHIERSGYECPNCKTSCQARRKEARRKE